MSASFTEIVENIKNDVRVIVKGEIELAKAELMPQVKSAGIGVGLFGGAGYLLFVGSVLLFLSGGFGVSWGYTVLGLEWPVALFAGFATLAVVLFVLAGVLVLIGKGRFKFSSPKETINTAEASVSSLRSAIKSSNSEIAAAPLITKKAD